MASTSCEESSDACDFSTSVLLVITASCDESPDACDFSMLILPVITCDESSDSCDFSMLALLVITCDESSDSCDFSMSALLVITCDESSDSCDFSVSALVVAAALLPFRVSIEDDSNLGSEHPGVVSRKNVRRACGFWVILSLLGVTLKVEVNLIPLDLA